MMRAIASSVSLSLAALGLCCIAKFLFGFFKFISVTFLCKKPNLCDYGAVKLSESPAARAWAVVTGASDGIGYQFALQLARKGFNIFAISRSENKLKNLANEIMENTNNKVVCETYSFDLCSNDDEKWAKLLAKIDSLPTDVGIFVNNAGENQSYPEFFNLVDEKVILNILSVNIVSSTRLTRGILPLLLKNSKTCKKRLILNVGSFAGLFPVPLLSTYSASKAFMITWSKALTSELSNTNVHIETILPYYVATKMSKISKPRLLVPSAQKFVQSAINKVGLHHLHSPYTSHSFMAWLTTILPKSIFTYLAFSTNMKIRYAALKKK